MLSRALGALLFLPAALRVVCAQSTSTTACNNSPSLCSRAYNNITYLGAHDSPFLRDAADDYDVSGNQYYNSTVQLSAGVRLLSAQVQMTNSTSSGQLHVCHTSCDLLDAGKLSDWLGEVNSWLVANPNEVVTVLLVNGADASAQDLATEYEEAGISTIAYTPTSTAASSASTTSGYAGSTSASATSSDWPTLQSMINNGTRLVNFVADLSDNTAAPYLLNEFSYIFENSYENTAPTDYSCVANRPSSVANNTEQALSEGLMPLMNHFLYEQEAFDIQAPNDTYITTTNSPNPSGGVGNLGTSADECTSSYGKAPNFILVDFFNVGPAIQTIDRLNGVSNAVGRTNVSTSVMSATSGAGAACIRVTMLCLTLLAAMLVVV
ncbi:hypothetical protein LTR85_002415 [Meristemomyces frigidus]|nr:hypothetical protein LTR85_002415 [Meristemomyces frigidus]